MTTLVVACTEDYTDWASPQTHAQGESKSITATIDSVKAIDMNGLNVQGPNPTVLDLLFLIKSPSLQLKDCLAIRRPQSLLLTL